MESTLQQILNVLATGVTPGINTKQIDDMAASLIETLGCKPAFLGYKPKNFGGEEGFPASCCVSINDEVIHGIPSADRKIALGDVVKIDLGLEKDGQFDDGATTVLCATVNAKGQLEGTSATARKLVKCTREALVAGVAAAKYGNTTHDIAMAIEGVAKQYGFHIIHGYGGHGIGDELHMEPHVPNEIAGAASPVKLEKGMRLAIEPMIGTNHGVTYVAKDGWTVKLRNGGLAAHEEQTVLID